MRRREFIALLGGASISTLIDLSAARAQKPAPTAASPQFPPWGFDLAGMDRKAKPGDDFFRYGNGGWFDRTVIAPDRSENNISLDLAEAAEQHVREIIERGAQGVEASARADATKFGAFYASFMDEARIELQDASPIAPILQRIRAAKSHDDVAELMGLVGDFTPSFFDFSIDIDAKNPARYVVSLSHGGLGLDDRDYYLSAGLADKKAAYGRYIAELLAMIGWQAPPASSAAILALETAIAEAHWPLADRRNSDKTYNPTSEAALAKAAPFPWRRLLQAGSLRQLDHLVVAEVSAFPKIAAIYAQTPIETLQAWLAFHVADKAAAFLSKRFVASHFEFRSKILTGAAELPARWKRGVRTVNGAMGEAIGRVYVAQHFPPEAKAQVEALIEHIRVAFAERIKRLTWMGPETKARALEKLARIRAKIGYPGRWRDYSNLQIVRDDLVRNASNAGKFEWTRQLNRLNAPVDRDEWHAPPQTVNAYYGSSLNEILFPAAILQAPFFDPAGDAAVNYGGIGAVIGHELTHGFDDDGRRYDGAGVLTNWWTEKDLQEFEARATALRKQYDAFEPLPGARVNGELTLGENIADVGGCLIALDAYRHSLAGKPAPVIDGFTGEQRFFLGYAQSWRGKKREDALRHQLTTDTHAPEEYRVNGVVRNMDDWYEAFGVQPGDKLYLANDTRVRIW